MPGPGFGPAGKPESDPAKHEAKPDTLEPGAGGAGTAPAEDAAAGVPAVDDPEAAAAAPEAAGAGPEDAGTEPGAVGAGTPPTPAPAAPDATASPMNPGKKARNAASTVGSRNMSASGPEPVPDAVTSAAKRCCSSQSLRDAS